MLNHINLNKVFVIDIETVPQYSYFEDMPLPLQELWEQKTSLQRKEEQTPAEFYERAGIQAEFGKIICISIGFFHQVEGLQHFRVSSFYGDNEVEILKNFVALLKKQPKDDIDGSMVKKVYYEDNDLKRIVKYCQKDVITTAQILLKFKGLPSISSENITLVD